MKVTDNKVSDNRISPDWDVKWTDGDAREGREGF